MRGVYADIAGQLSPRQRLILAAVVGTYIATAEPVGSRTVSKMPHINLSPASVRNVMADLEEMGLLTQPHISAGRVPTPLGLRVYVDSLLKVPALDAATRERIDALLLDAPGRSLPELLEAASRALSETSRLVAVVAGPDPAQERLKHIQFIRLGRGVILAVLVCEGGVVQNRLVESDEELSQEELNKFSRYLNELLGNLTLREVKRRLLEEMAQEKNRFDALLHRALALGTQALDVQEEGRLLIKGQRHLLETPEFSDIDQLRRVFEAFEEKSTLLRLLEKSMAARGVQIFIGPESEVEGFENLSAVTASYGGSVPLGALGVLGPTRMDYSRVIPTVEYLAQAVSRLLEEDGA